MADYQLLHSRDVAEIALTTRLPPLHDRKVVPNPVLTLQKERRASAAHDAL